MVDDKAEEDSKRTIPMLKSFVVFNLDQNVGLEHLRPELRTSNVFESIQHAEAILTKNNAKILDGGTRAFYQKLIPIVKHPWYFFDAVKYDT